MKHGLGLSFVLLLCAAAEAADRPAPQAHTTLPKPETARVAVAKPLRLGVRDIRNYMMPNEFRSAIQAPDSDSSAVVVEGTRNAPPLQSKLLVPGGLGSLWYATRHPSQSWRIFLPDVNAPAMGPTYDKIPPPVFRWGP